MAILALWGAAVLVYSNSFTIAFQFDDSHTVQSNIFVRSLKYAPLYFADSRTYSYRPENSGYRPMSTLMCAMAFQLSHLEPWGYHLIKLAEHVLISILIFLICMRLLPERGSVASLSSGRYWTAFLGALVFAVHRANTETVDYITAISTLQAGLFQILGFYFYLRMSSETVGARRWTWLWCSLLVYMLGMMSKEEGVTLPGVIFFHELLYGQASKKQPFKEKLVGLAKILWPYVAVAAVFIALRAMIQPAVADVSRGNIPRFIYFITQIRSWFHYIFLFFWPVELNADNLAFEFSSGLSDWRVWACFAFHLSVWSAAWRAQRQYRFAAFAVAWFYVTILPASSVFVLVEAVNEHRMYTPFMMLAPLSVWCVLTILSNAGMRFFRDPAATFRASVCLIVGIASLLGAGAWARNEVWQTDVSLWRDVYAKNPDSPRAMNVLGIALINSAEHDEGRSLLEKCHAIAPAYLPCVVHLSIAYAHLKKYDQGLTLLKQALPVNPDYPHLNFHLGLYYKDYFGNFEEAYKHFQKVYEATSGRFFQAAIKIAEMAIEDGRPDEAITIAWQVLGVDQTNGDAWDVLGRAKMVKGDLTGALDIFVKLVRSAPMSARYRFNRANFAERAHDYRNCAQYFESITKSNPESIQAWRGLARCKRAIGDAPGAEKARSQATELIRTGKWGFIPSLLLVDEHPRQVRP